MCLNCRIEAVGIFDSASREDCLSRDTAERRGLRCLALRGNLLSLPRIDLRPSTGRGFSCGNLPAVTCRLAFPASCPSGTAIHQRAGSLKSRPGRNSDGPGVPRAGLGFRVVSLSRGGGGGVPLGHLGPFGSFSLRHTYSAKGPFYKGFAGSRCISLACRFRGLTGSALNYLAFWRFRALWEAHGRYEPKYSVFRQLTVI